MNWIPRIFVVALISCSLGGWAQEAQSGVEIGGTLTGQAAYTHQLGMDPRDGGPVTAGARLLLYPTWKLSSHWSVTGVVQLHTRPFFYEDFSTQGYGAKADILQAALTYSRFWQNGSVVVRAGQLTSAFGSFLLRYDDAQNPLIDVPLSYGYYERGVTNFGLAGAQVDATAGKLDLRAQFVNSSPANRRSLFDKDQYGSWTAGAGYTIVQGLRVGVSAYRGPYLDRQSETYYPGDPRPKDLPGSAYALELQWGAGAWKVFGELHRFEFAHRAIPSELKETGYAEIRRVVHPRWYVATRLGFLRSKADAPREVYETAVGYRPNRHQVLKIGYEIQSGRDIRGTLSNTFGLQLVTVFRPVSIARD